MQSRTSKGDVEANIVRFGDLLTMEDYLAQLVCAGFGDRKILMQKLRERKDLNRRSKSRLDNPDSTSDLVHF